MLTFDTVWLQSVTRKSDRTIFLRMLEKGPVGKLMRMYSVPVSNILTLLIALFVILRTLKELSEPSKKL